MGGVVRIAKSIFSGSTPLPQQTWRDSSGAAAPANIQKFGDASMKAIVTKDRSDLDALENEVEAPPAITEQETLLKKKKKGRYNTILSGKEGSLGAANVERKSLLGN